MEKTIGKIARLREVRRDIELARSIRQQAEVDRAREALERARRALAQLEVDKSEHLQRLAQRWRGSAFPASDLASAGIDVLVYDRQADAKRESIEEALKRLREEEAKLADIQKSLRRVDAKCETLKRTGERLERDAARRAEALEEALADEAALLGIGAASIRNGGATS